MLKKLFIISLSLKTDAFVGDRNNNTTTVIYTQPSYIKLSFNDITGFKDSKGRVYTQRNGSITNQRGKLVIILDGKGIPINSEIISQVSYSNKFGIVGNLRSIKEFYDINNNIYFIRNINGTYQIYDNYGRIIVLNNKNGVPIEI
jgi:hypothetical protein